MTEIVVEEKRKSELLQPKPKKRPAKSFTHKNRDNNNPDLVDLLQEKNSL